MKITKLLKIQKDLDQAIEKKHNVKASEIVNQKIINEFYVNDFFECTNVF